MSNFLRKITRNKNKDYKVLYETELQNRKAYETRYKQIKEENIELQKGSGLAELRKTNIKLMEENHILTNDNKELNELVAKLRIELEDCCGFLEQEKEVTKILKERFEYIKFQSKWGIYNIEKEKIKNYDDEFIQERVNIELLYVYELILKIMENVGFGYPNKTTVKKIENYYLERSEHNGKQGN